MYRNKEEIIKKFNENKGKKCSIKIEDEFKTETIDVVNFLTLKFEKNSKMEKYFNSEDLYYAWQYLVKNSENLTYEQAEIIYKVIHNAVEWFKMSGQKGSKNFTFLNIANAYCYVHDAFFCAGYNPPEYEISR
jgi:hypothetical protein